MTGSYETVNYVKIFLFRKGEGNLESFSNIIKMNLFFSVGQKVSNKLQMQICVMLKSKAK